MPLKDDKVALVKRLIRANNYRHCDKTLQQCIASGIEINLNTLSRFAEKLELIDRVERNRRHSRQAKKSSLAPRDMTYEQIKQREAEITFELGALRIKENALLIELDSLSKRLKNKH